MASRIEDVLNCLYIWTTAGVKFTLAILDRLVPQESALPPIVDRASSSSCATVPALPPATMAETAAYMAKSLFDLKAHVKAVPAVSLDPCDYVCLQELDRLQIVHRTRNEFSEDEYALNLDRLRASLITRVARPLIAFRQEVPGLRSLKAPKLYMMVRLREIGWRPGATQPFQAGARRLYKESFAMPASYFCCLVQLPKIFAKGVDALKHDGTSKFYLCLLRLPKEKLLPLLERMAIENGIDDEVLKVELKDAEGESDSGSDGSGDRGDRPRAALGGDILPPLLHREQEVQVPWWQSEWKRCWVVLHGARTKIWFDNSLGPGGMRRAWANCQQHGCGCIRTVSHDRNWFATALMLWHLHGVGQAEMTRQEHLSYWPSDADVDEALPSASFEDF